MASETKGVTVIRPNEIARTVRDIVNEAEEFVILASPYFAPWTQMQADMRRAAAQRKVEVRLIVRDDQLAKLSAALEPCHDCGISVFARPRLHAKLYVNERAAVVTSMNLLESSAIDSWEAAIRIEKDGAADIHHRLLRQAEEMLDGAAEVRSPKRAARHPELSPVPVPPTSQAARGACIRCGDKIRFDPEKPLCLSCFGSWRKYANRDYEEKRCHSCGKDHVSSFAKPLCKPCWASSKA